MEFFVEKESWWMVFCNPLPLTEYPGLESTFANLLRSDLSFQLEECSLLLLTCVLKTSILLMDECLPALHLELLEMCWETVELVVLLPRNLLPLPWKFVSQGSGRRLTEECTRSIECCTFDGTKSNYLFDPVNKWSVLEDLESCLEIKEERQTSWHFPTLTILWIRDPSRRESFLVFFPESHRQLRNFYFSPSIDLLTVHPFFWLGSSCLARNVFTDCIVNTFLWDVFLKLCVCTRCKLRQEVPFKLIFIRYNMEPLGFLVFFLTLRAQGMRRRWRRRRTRRSPPSLLFTWLLTSLLSSSRWRTRMGRRGCATSFPCLSFLERFAPFWTRISLDNSLLYFWAMRAILLIILIKDRGLGSTFILSWRWENTTFNQNRDFMK